MAVTSVKVHSAMVLKFKTGVDAKGNDLIKSQSFSKVKVGATDEDILAVGAALGDLLEFALTDVSRQDQTTIMNS